MNLLAINLNIFFLLHREDIPLCQTISIQGFQQSFDFSLASLLIIHRNRYLVCRIDSHALPHYKVTFFLIGMIEDIISTT